MANAVKVVVRVRPFIKNESQECKSAVETRDGSLIRVDMAQKVGIEPPKWKGFPFDVVYGVRSEQKRIYDESVASFIDKLIQGFNSTVFAYGQTSSGKTHTVRKPQHAPHAPPCRVFLPRRLVSADDGGRR